MKAIEINGTIKVYSKLPNSWKGVMGNFSKLSDEEIKAYGFYDVVTPEYNKTSETLSAVFWNESDKVFTYNVSDIDFNGTLAELNALSKLNATDWYITRKTEKNIDIPSSVTNERDAIRSKVTTAETEINNLTTKKAVAEYSTLI